MCALLLSYEVINVIFYECTYYSQFVAMMRMLSNVIFYEYTYYSQFVAMMRMLRIVLRIFICENNLMRRIDK